MGDFCFDRESTLELLAASGDIPSLPDRFAHIQRVIRDPMSGADDLADIIRTDQATTAVILKFANSAVFNPMRTPVCELSKAIARLGSRETAHIASAMSLMYGIVLPTGMNNIRLFWAHAYGVAIVAEHLAQRVDPAEQICSHERAFMAGLLHDIGRAALGMRVDFAYFEKETGHLFGDDLIRAEERYYGVNHAEAGRHLLRLWGFPDDICMAVADHHNQDSSLFLARLCSAADNYIRNHISDSTSFDNMHETVTVMLQSMPPDLVPFPARPGRNESRREPQ